MDSKVLNRIERNNMLKKLLHFSITTKEKAVYAFVVSSVGAYMAQSGLTWHQVLSVNGAKALIVGVLTHQLVYWVENSNKAQI